jgi:hypothetical protein
MYHPGKVVEILRKTDKEVISADDSVQAVLEMWDENILTLIVNSKIESKLKNAQIVLVDYRPDEKHTPPVPKHEIVKIIGAKKGENVWNTYKEMYEKRNRKANAVHKQPAQSYIG